MLKATFSKHWLIEISITYVMIKSEVTKIWYNSSNSYKWSLYWMITWKLLFDGEANDTFDKRGCKFCEEDFSCGKMSKFLAVGWDCLPSSVPIVSLGADPPSKLQASYFFCSPRHGKNLSSPPRGNATPMRFQSTQQAFLSP